jgi:hypothetical protein
MTTINPLSTDVDAFTDAVQNELDALFDVPDDYRAIDLDDFFMDLDDAADRVTAIGNSDDRTRCQLIKLAAYAAIIWHALGENKTHKEIDYAA